MEMASLPIADVLPTLHRVLAEGTSAVLQAPPGAGKTTGVPPSLLDAQWLTGKRILMLEPRRLAARAAARRIAANLGQAVGETVGFRIRGESRVGPRTRIEVVTEGILTRMLLEDPALDEVGIVLFDEFHERSIHADLGLALTLLGRTILRDDLRVLVMSATLDGAGVADLLGGAPIVTSSGRSHPVETRYLPPRPGVRLESATVSAIHTALDQTAGDILVFLPGAGEIRRVEAMLGRLSGTDVLPLHGNLPAEAQDHALRPPPRGRRKVVLATSIAETSLTIDGVRTVVDAGWSRVPRYSPRTGMSRLVTARVSLASADQRSGRAGRQGPGVCYRLWSEHQHGSLVPAARPEILEADLAPLALDLAAAGVSDPGELAWLDAPPAAAFSEARSLLGQLGALDPGATISAHGRAMSRLPLHPRLAHMVLKSLDLGDAATACDVAALLTERDVLGKGEGVPEADIRSRLDLLRGYGERASTDLEALRRARAEARRCRDSPLLRRGPRARAETPSVGALVALAYPDRIAQRRPDSPGRYLLRNGLGATLDPQSMTGEPYLAVAEVEGKQREGRILLAAPIALEEIDSLFGSELVSEDEVRWDAAAAMVTSRRRTRLGALVLRDAPIRDPDAELVTAALLQGIRESGLESLTWTTAARGIRSRVAFVRRLDPEWPDLSSAALAGRLEEWLGPLVGGMRRLGDVSQLDLASALEGMLGRERMRRLEALAPTHVTVPSGSRLPIDYGDPEAPFLAVRLQEVFGWSSTPMVGGGRVPVTLHLLSPAFRPVQVTRDLAGFWRGAYFEVRKDLKGRYPRHAWPDDPVTAEPTRRVKPRDRPGNSG
jgi:ATP-dependent helicase HrpB